MIKEKSKKEDLIKAILSGNKGKLRKILNNGKPEKWITVVVDYKKNTNSYLGEIISDNEMGKILFESEKEFQIKLVIVNFKNDKNEPDNKWEIYELSTILNICNESHDD